MNQSELVMSQKMIQVGNSKALIIPSRIIKKWQYDGKTEFDIVDTPEGILFVRKRPMLEELVFPKLTKPEISAEVTGLNGVVSFTPEELEKDERLQYILSR